MSHSPVNVFSVAMPLGNAKDLSFRSAEALEEADWIFCEDKRKLRHIVNELSLSLKGEVKITTLPGDEEWSFDWSRLEKEECQNVVIVSDAGTPVINDPGKALIVEADRRQWPVYALPGPSAPTLALQRTGGFGLPFVFAGFAPKVTSSNKKAFQNFVSTARMAKSFVFFDTKHQVEQSLKNLIEAGWGDAKLFLLRELTKTYEEQWAGSVSEVLMRLQQHLDGQDSLGELTLVMEGLGEASGQVDQISMESLLDFRNAAPRKAAKFLASHFGLTSQESYKLISG